MARVDSALKQWCVQPHVGKNVDGATDGTCIGVDLVGGLALAANAAKLWRFLQCVSAFGSLEDEASPSERGGAYLSPNALASVLGIGSWFCQLNRPLFAVLHNVYTFTTAEPKNDVRRVPVEALLGPLGVACFPVRCGFDASLAARHIRDGRFRRVRVWSFRCHQMRG